MHFGFRSKLVWIVFLTSLSSVLTGCLVGPNFHSVPAPNVNSYTESPDPKKTVSIGGIKAGKAQYFAAGKDIPAEWWWLFHSTELNDLIRTGLINSPNLAAAVAAIQQAQENANAQVGTSLFPAVNLQINAERQRLTVQEFGFSNAQGTTFNLYTPQVTVSYTLDIFGGARRQIEALCAQVDYQKYQLEAAYLTLTSNIVIRAVNIASYRAQIQATHDLITIQERLLQIVSQQFQIGGASRADILSQQSQLAQTRATLPPLMQNLSASEHALSVLVGAFPSENHLPLFDLNKLTLPTELPVSLPSLLVRQRPDIRASEALLHAASAQIGVATANLLPQITISGAYGWTATTLGDLFSPTSKIWNITGELLQPIFNGGALHAKRRAAIAAFKQAAAQYHQTVLQAFQNVADTLRALENDAQTLKAQEQAEIAARESLDLTEKQFRIGGVNYLSLLNAERQYQQAHISRIQAQAARYQDTAALFQALGGGWWNRDPVKDP